MTAITAGVRLQLCLIRNRLGSLLIFVTVPFFSAIFLSGVREVGRVDLLAFATIGPGFIGLWVVSLDIGGSIIDSERVQGTFELQTISPSSFSLLMAGRMIAVTVLGMLTIPETVLFARYVFGVDLPVRQPGLMAATLLVTAVAMTGTSTALGSIFVAARAAKRFGNVLGYPFYILGGLLVPVSLLPLWVQPLSWFTYLYWSAGLLRATVGTAPVNDVGGRLLAVLAVGVATYAFGAWLTGRILDRLRGEGTIGLS